MCLQITKFQHNGDKESFVGTGNFTIQKQYVDTFKSHCISDFHDIIDTNEKMLFLLLLEMQEIVMQLSDCQDHHVHASTLCGCTDV